MCDLERIFGSVLEHVPEEVESTFLFSATTLPQPPAVLSTDRLAIRTGFHDYYAYTVNRVDNLHFFAHKRTYRLLGLCFLAKIFHTAPHEVRLELTNPHSEVRTIILDYSQHDGWHLLPGYDTRPHHFTYVAQAVDHAPQHREDKSVPDWLLPLFALNHQEQQLHPHTDEWKNPTTIRCAGSDYGSILFATLLLNFGRTNDIQCEITLESPFGYGGVGYGSAEVSLWRPDSAGWIDLIKE